MCRHLPTYHISENVKCCLIFLKHLKLIIFLHHPHCETFLTVFPTSCNLTFAVIFSDFHYLASILTLNIVNWTGNGEIEVNIPTPLQVQLYSWYGVDHYSKIVSVNYHEDYWELVHGCWERNSFLCAYSYWQLMNGQNPAGYFPGLIHSGYFLQSLR